MAGEDLVRPSRDGDQFHYHWAARHCLELLPGSSDLIAVSVEGASTHETAGDAIVDGEELIDVGLYFGGEALETARLVRYIQLKHSTRRTEEAWTASGIEKTVKGFAKRYTALLKQFPIDDVARRFQFTFTTNRPIEAKLREALADLASGTAARHADLAETLVNYTKLSRVKAAQFFSLFSLEGNEGDLWTQRNLLSLDLGGYLPDADYDAPVQLKELVTRKATTEFKSNPSIRRYDVLRALKTTEEQLQPAPCLIADPSDALPREQEGEVLEAILTATAPVVIHADGGMGKSVLAARLAASMPDGYHAVLYDCYGDGLYRNALNFRHRHRDALVQMANELAARGLCHPLIPSAHADAKQYMRAFLHRVEQSVRVLRARKAGAILCLIVDAADNADMAAEEQKEPASFVHDLIRAPLPDGVRLAMTCRTHRRGRLAAPSGACSIELQPFSPAESATHLRTAYPLADGRDVAEFAYLSSSNPRVQALAIAQHLPLPEMLKRLGPTPTTVDAAIGELLEGAVARLRDNVGPLETAQIDAICQGLAVLRPLVPIRVLAKLSEVPESAIRSFAFDFGRPLLVKGESLHFLDEPAETWFRDRYQPDTKGFSEFLERLRPLAEQSSYVAAALPQLLLQAGRLDELVELALSAEALPTGNPLERRDVELQRLTFALKASLRARHYAAAAKLALKAGGECAGEERQVNLIQANTDIAAALMAPDRIEELVSRRTFGAGWMGSHHAYDAGLLSGREELAAEGASRLRMAIDWLSAWARRPQNERTHEEVTDADRAELALTLLRLRGATAAVDFLRRWRPRRIAFDTGALLARRLADLGRYDQLEALAVAARNDIWLLLALAQEARAAGQELPEAALTRLLRLLSDLRVHLPEEQGFSENWKVLYAVTSSIELALRVLTPVPEVWAGVIRRYLPNTPPSVLTSPFGFDRAPLLHAYALEAALRGATLALLDVAPTDVRAELENTQQSYSRSQEKEIFLQEVGGLLPWVILSAGILCGRAPADLGEAIKAAVDSTAQSARRSYRESGSLRNATSKQWLRILGDTGATSGPLVEAFCTWRQREKNPLWPDTLTALSRSAARMPDLGELALDLASEAYNALEATREDAESRADAYLRLARAIYTVSAGEAGAYFDSAVEIVSRIGEENLERWAALLNLAHAAAEQGRPRSESAYRLSRIAELTYEYVARDKHFDWNGTVEALTDLCPSSAFAILSRWRDRRFGDAARLLPLVINRMVERGQLTHLAPIALAGLDASWKRFADLKRFLASESETARRTQGAEIAYRYMRLQRHDSATWSHLRDLEKEYNLNFSDLDRLFAAGLTYDSSNERTSEFVFHGKETERRGPDWETIFRGVDLTASEALRSAYDSMRTYGPPYGFEEFFRQACTRVTPGCEAEFVRIISTWPDFGFFTLLDFLKGHPRAWHKRISFRHALRDAVLVVCRREPHRIHRYGRERLLDTLVASGIMTERDVTQATLVGYAERVDTLGAGALFHLVDALTANLTSDEAHEALCFGLDLFEGILRPEDGDGAWRAELSPQMPLISALAGYLWAGLASPVAGERWEYAHAVRAIVELGWGELLAALVAWAESNTAGAFVDQGLEFYLWHGRQWLLVGLARGSLENPKALRPAIPVLRQLLAGDHVVIRALAAQCLRNVAASGEPGSDNWGALDAINVSPFPVHIYSGWSGSDDSEAESSGEPQPVDEKYYFGTDIRQYRFQPLGRAFGINEAAVERRALKVLREKLGSRERRDDARHIRRLFREGETHHSHGMFPATDDLRAYHAYHAMMLVAGALLKERPVRQHTDETLDNFQDWLSEYLLTRQDGRWLVDRRDPKIVEGRPVAGDRDGTWYWSVDKEYLDRQLLAEDGMTVLWGHWTDGDDNRRETVSIRSALVSEEGAEALLAALQTMPEFRCAALPTADSDDNFETESARLWGWVLDEAWSRRLDAKDSWSEGLRYPGPCPAPEVIGNLALTPENDGRLWRGQNGTLLRSETWTRTQGYGNDAESVPGWRFCANVELLQALHQSFGGSRLIVSVEVQRQPPRYGQDEDEIEAYPWPYTCFYLVGANGATVSL